MKDEFMDLQCWQKENDINEKQLRLVGGRQKKEGTTNMMRYLSRLVEFLYINRRENKHSYNLQ